MVRLSVDQADDKQLIVTLEGSSEAPAELNIRDAGNARFTFNRIKNGNKMKLSSLHSKKLRSTHTIEVGCEITIENCQIVEVKPPP